MQFPRKEYLKEWKLHQGGLDSSLMQCPMFVLGNPPTAAKCDCEYFFASGPADLAVLARTDKSKRQATVCNSDQSCSPAGGRGRGFVGSIGSRCTLSSDMRLSEGLT